MASPLHKCGIYRLLVERLSDNQLVLVAFCRIPANEHRLWPLHPSFLLSGYTSVPPSLLPLGHAFPAAADCLFVLLLVIKVHLLISSSQLLQHYQRSTLILLCGITTEVPVRVQKV